MPAESRDILQIDFQNPQFARTDDWAKAIGGQQFPFADYEWTQVLAPDQEYDQFELVGATGWIIDPHYSDADLPLTHPFLDASSNANVGTLPHITDWEFHFMVDTKPTDYRFLLAAGNEQAARLDDADDIAKDLKLDISKGLLGVEIDSGLVPAGFKAAAKTGDRVAVFGRWIVDTAHVSAGGSFRSEIHPPLLMARASVQPLASGQPGTRVLFTSRPYLVGQRFTLDKDQIYNDAAGDDGPTLIHLAKEYARISAPVVPLSLQLEAHPKIKSHPFRGAHLLHMKVRPPVAAGGPHHSMGGLQPRLAVSFQFMVRSGCAVQVSSSAADTIDVHISLSDAGYTPPPLPHRGTKNWKRDEFDAMRQGIGLGILLGEGSGAVLERMLGTAEIDSARVVAILERGINIDLYDPLPSVDINDAQHAVTRAWANEVPAGAGIVSDNDQPFPIFGWLEATWQLSGIPG